MYTLFIGFRKIDVFPSIWEAKKFASESNLTGGGCVKTKMTTPKSYRL